MDYAKKWYLSKTVWGALLAFSAPLLQLVGIYIDEGTQGELAAAIATVAGASGGLIALFGRISAKSSLTR